ncbi:MAG: ethanolamine utilization protein EutH [Ruminococcaceae bacterium]|nr:ethanolamine utilization protein EutH [Oscillospiraceae bacterium]
MSYFSIGVVAVMVLFALVGIFDSLFLKNKLGMGEEFQKGIEMIGPLCMAIVGIIALVPEIAWVIEHTLTPLYTAMGLDPSMAVTAILAIDMGGFQLAATVAQDALIGQWAGVVYGSMMGATIVFSIPVGLASIQKKDVSAFSKGILYGIAAIPVGTFVGGLMLGIPAFTVLLNLIIPIVFSALIVLCLALWPRITTRVFIKFSELVNLCAMIGLGLAILKDLVLLPISATGAFDISVVPFFNILGSTGEGIAVAGAVGLVLAGALPFVAFLNRALRKPLQKFSAKTGMTEAGVTGFLLSCANNMAMFATMSKMKEREKILNVAFAVCAAFVIGDHLAFAAANASACIAPMMAAKLISGVIAVLIAALFTKNVKDESIDE